MQYGYFDDAAREYVITRPDTPKSWINYLGSRLYGGIITQNAGGYSFYQSGGTGRLLRMRFNNVPADTPGRYIYLRDDATGDYWSTSWQPVGKPLETYDCRVRHGLGYSVFESCYADIEAVCTYFVPKGQAFECWWLRLTNQSDTPRRVSAFSYAELTNEWHFRQDLENLQYSQYVVHARYHDGMIQRWNNYNPGSANNYFGLAGAEVTSFDCDRDLFLGDYRTPASPLAVERGRCSDSETVGDNACASLHTALELAPGESRELVYILGVGKPDESWNGLPPGREVLHEFGDPARLAAELDTIRGEWAAHLHTFQVETGDAELNSMINVWHAYQTHMTFNWSRGVSLVEAGDRDGLGFRDTVQDMLAVTHSIPDAVRDRLTLMLTAQTAEGGGIPLVKPLTHKPGHERAPNIEQYRSDDALWLPLTVANFVYETGDLDYLKRVLPYADSGSATVLEHLLQALRFSMNHRGQHGLIQGLAADWNDCVKFGTEGESLFTTFLFYAACQRVIELARLLGNSDAVVWCEQQLETIKMAADAHGWDGEWFIRGIGATGGKLGSKDNTEGKIYLESNVWAVISGAASLEQGTLCMDAVGRYLGTQHGVKLCHPAHTEPIPGVSLSLLVFPPGHKENGGIFCHSNSWVIVAEALLGRGDRAYDYYRRYLPARFNNQAELRQVEPYVYSQFTYADTTARFGQSRNPWLTGTASWTYIGVTQYILGIQPTLDGLRVNPCIPAEWDGFTVRRQFRGHWLTIGVENPTHVQRGVVSVTLNGDPVEGNVIPATRLQADNEVRVVMG